MFRYEKDMIPVLKEHLSNLFNTNYFVEEFNTGIGIADLVFAKNIGNRNVAIKDFESISWVLKYINASKGKKKSIQDTVDNFKLNRMKFVKLLNYLEQLNYVSIKENDFFIVHKKVKPRINEFYSVEAKLKDWKSGLYQAMRYKNYSHKSYLAISENFLRFVNIEMLKENNIGLISVSNTSIKILVKPKKALPINEVAHYYLSESFTERL